MDYALLISGIESFIIDAGLSYEEGAELYSVFLKELRSEIFDLREKIEHQDYAVAGRIIHNVIGISGNYHIQEILKFTLEINQIIKKLNDPDFFEGYDLKELKASIISDIEKLDEMVDFCERNIIDYFKKRGVYGVYIEM